MKNLIPLLVMVLLEAIATISFHQRRDILGCIANTAAVWVACEIMFNGKLARWWWAKEKT